MKKTSTGGASGRLVSRVVVLFMAILLQGGYCEATDFQNTFAPGWTLFTMPCAPTSADPAVTFAAPFKDVVGIEDGKYVLLGDMTEVGAGKSYWAYFENETSVTISGTDLTGSGQDVTLQPGWNMIGSPFEASSWSEATIGGEPVGESTLIESSLYYYDATQDDYVAATNLSQWRGYFIKIGGTESVTLVIDNSGTVIPQGSIAGTANLQGLTDHTGINVNFDPDDSELDPFDITTGSNGSFSQIGLNTGGYTLTASFTDFTSFATHVTVIEDTQTQVGTTLLLDENYPVISGMLPANGSTKDTATPTISATFSDAGSGVDASGVAITVRGVDVTSSAAITTTGFTYTPSAALSDGATLVSVSIDDLAGNTTVATSSFTIETVVQDPDQPSNVTAGECTHGTHTLLCLAWDAPTNPDVTGYNVYVYHDTETISSPYNGERPVPVVRFTVGGLTPGENYGVEITSVEEEGGLIVNESEHSDRSTKSTVANSGNQAVFSFRAISEDSAQSSGRRAMSRTSGNLLAGLVAVSDAYTEIEDSLGVVVATGTTGEFGWIEISGLDAGNYDMNMLDDGGTPEDPDDDIFLEKDGIELVAGGMFTLGTAYLDDTGTGEFCGDGILNKCEQCDDENRTDGDGCSATCTLEASGVHSGMICADETWALADSPHIVVGPIVVRSFYDPTLTIEAGSVVKFDSGTSMTIGTNNTDGGLIADGSGGAITFTSNAGSPAAGDWAGITFAKYALAASVLDNFTIEYAGSASASLVIGGDINKVHNGTIQNGAGVGVLFQDGGYAENGFATNTVTGHALHPIQVYADYVTKILGGNVITGNGSDVIKVDGDVVYTAGTWLDHGVPYELLGDVTIEKSITITDDLTVTLHGDFIVADFAYRPILTIGAGGTWKFDADTEMRVGVDTGYTDYGSLIADGASGAIKFTSNAAVPSAGDWKGITLGTKARPDTLLDNVTIEYAGGATASLTVSSQIDKIHNGTIQNGAGIGVDFQDGGYASNGFATTTVTGHALHPISVYAAYVPYIDGGNTVTGNGSDVIKVTGDLAQHAGEWMNMGVPFEVAGDVTFDASITFDEGIEITFDGDVTFEQSCEFEDNADVTTLGDITIAGFLNPYLTIGAGSTFSFGTGANVTFSDNSGVDGGLIADGSSGVITFTSNETSPAAGDWEGITFNPGNGFDIDDSVMDNVVIEYAGSATASLVVDAEMAKIHNCTIRSGGGIGVHFKEHAALTSGFATNTVTAHTEYPIRIAVGSIPYILAGNSISGNGSDVIKVEGGTATAAGTWLNMGADYEVLSAVTFEEATTFESDMTITFGGDVAFNEDATFGSNVTVIVKGDVSAGDFVGRPFVTIGAGGTWRFDPGTKMEIGIDEGSGDDGGMIADGTGGAITFTSNAGTPEAGDWEGITFGTRTRPESLLDNVVIEYAGVSSGAALTVMDEVESIDNTTVRYSAGVGMDFQSGGYTDTSFATNTITGNASYPINIYAGYVANVAAGNAFTGNTVDAIRVMGGTVVEIGTWLNHGVSYVIQNDVLFERDVTFAENLTVIAYGDIQLGQWSYRPLLTIGAGSTLKFDSGAGIDVLDTLRGRVYADGTSSTITFTSNQASPSAGDWAGITFGVDTYSGTVITNCVISYGGSNGYGNIYLNDTSTNVSITNNTISNSSAYGVYVDVDSTFDAGEEITNTFTGNASGDVFRE